MRNKIEKYLFKMRNSSKTIFSIGLGGLFSLYIIQLCRVKLLPFIKEQGELSEIAISMGGASINSIEIFILLVSLTAIISAPLLSEKSSKGSKQVFILVILIFFNLMTFMSIVIQQQVNTIFIISITIASIYLVRIGLDILKIIYNWTKQDKKVDDQPDVAKLTLIWAVIAFILGIMI